MMNNIKRFERALNRAWFGYYRYVKFGKPWTAWIRPKPWGIVSDSGD